MSIIYEERRSDSPYVEAVIRGRTISDGAPSRPAEISWHMVFSKRNGRVYPLVVGPWSTAGVVTYTEGAELLWIKFRLGTFMPHLPTRKLLNTETLLPEAANQSFWLKSCAWQFPDYDNVETFIDRLVRDDVLVCDPVVTAALGDQLQPEAMSARTVRHRFLQATGLSQNHILQFERAKQAAALLERGVPILDTVHKVGYFDQSHLTRSLKRFIGKTPSQQLVRLCEPE